VRQALLIMSCLRESDHSLSVQKGHISDISESTHCSVACKSKNTAPSLLPGYCCHAFIVLYELGKYSNKRVAQCSLCYLAVNLACDSRHVSNYIFVLISTKRLNLL
jgi:hypothetical protein